YGRQRTGQALGQLRVECDLSLEQLGYRAIALGVARKARELLRADSRDLGAQRERRAADLESLRSIRLERHGGLRREFARREACHLQREGERHGEAPRMGCGNELLRIGALLVLEARLV